MSHDGPRTLRDRALATTALFLLILAFILPWWVVRYADSTGHVYETVAPRVFTTVDPYTTASVPHITGAFLAIVTLALFLRVAGKSWHYEPAIWQRTMGAGAIALGFALLSSLFWPQEVPTFWGKHTYSLTESGDSFTETALPGLAWWCALLALLCLAWAWWTARGLAADDASDK